MHIPRFVRISLLAAVMLAVAAPSFAGVLISVRIGPPPLPVYVQPACPGDGYIWTPGYWAYGPDGYYWVPGTWVLAPEPGYLWTPGYWGWSDGFYVWHVGYWGPHVGFYGGINYGFGYFGDGYSGGYWRDRTFYYNRSVTNVNITNVHIYNQTVVNNNVTVNRVSYNGGRGGINSRPTRDDARWEHERHFEPTHMQVDHEHGARGNREFLASVNHGRPNVAATARPGEFHGRDNGPSRPETRRPESRPMDRAVPRPEGSARNERGMDRPNAGRPNAGRSNADRPSPGRPNMDRPARQDANHGNDGFRPTNRPDSRPEPRAENRGGARPTSYHPQSPAPRNDGPRGNAAPRDNGQHGGGEAHGNGPHGGNEGHGRH